MRLPQIVEVARHYGLTIATCVPADPQSKGGSEATVRVAGADLVPTDHNLRPAYRSFGEVEAACEAFMAEVNTRPHRSTMEPPVIRLAEEHDRLHRLPGLPHTLCFGETRKVNWQSLISVGGAQYSVPHELIDQRVWARNTGEELVVIDVDGRGGPREVARHQLTTPGRPSIQDEHYPPKPAGALERRPRARSEEERAFLALGPGAERWLIQGAQRVRRKMAEAVDLAKLHGTEALERALAACAQAGRFGDGDLAQVLTHQQQAGGELIPFPARSEDHSLQRSTKGDRPGAKPPRVILSVAPTAAARRPTVWTVSGSQPTTLAGHSPMLTAEMIPSGRAKTFANRVAWAMTHTYQAGLLQRPRRWVYRITPTRHRSTRRATRPR